MKTSGPEPLNSSRIDAFTLATVICEATSLKKSRFWRGLLITMDPSTDPAIILARPGVERVAERASAAARPVRVSASSRLSSSWVIPNCTMRRCSAITEPSASCQRPGWAVTSRFARVWVS